MADSDLKLYTDEASVIKKKKAVYEALITITINKLNALSSENKLTVSVDKAQINKIQEFINNIKACDNEIGELLASYNVKSQNNDLFKKEIEKGIEYDFEFNENSLPFNKYFESESTNKNETVNNNESLIEILSKVNINKNRLSPIQCDNFDGNTTDRLLFHNFLIKFENVILINLF